MSKIVSNTANKFESKLDAFPYQTKVFLALKDLDYSAIFLEQGLGKTKIAIDLMLYWLNYREIDTVLVVTKKHLIQNWIDELRIHSYIHPAILSNDKHNNFYVLNSPTRIIITNFETISTDKNRILLFLKSRDVAIVVDESTKLKNPHAKITKDYFDLSDEFKIKTIMTGTPISNRPYDIWAQIYFLDKGKHLGNNFELFKSNTNLSNKLSNDIDARERFEKTVSQIYNKIDSFTVRETKKSSGISLPQKKYYSIKASFEPIQLSMYNKVINDLSIEVEKDGNKILDDETASLKRLLRLNQVASNPKLIDESYNCISGKEQKLDEILEEIYKRGEKVIVWSNFIENINMFTNKYKKYNPRKIHGSMAIDERNRSIKAFKEDKSCFVLFATPQAAKEGLTLTVANNVVFYDRSFNLDDYLQAQDRIHRISQEKTCNIYNIMMTNSIDGWIDNLLEAKQYAAFLAQGDINLSEYRRGIDYSYGDIIRAILHSRRNPNGNSDI